MPGARRRIGWGAFDQGISSLQNIALVLLTARGVSPRDFGAFTLVYAFAVVAIGLGQTLLSEPYLLVYAAGERPEQEEVAALCRGLALSAALGLALLVCAVGFVAPPPLHSSLLALGMSVPGLVLLDTSRLMAIAQKRPGRLLAVDGLWTALWLAVTLIVRPGSAAGYLLVWGLAATAVAVWSAFPLDLGLAAFRRSTSLWNRELRPTAVSLTGEFFTLTASAQISLIAITGFLGYAATGGIRGAQALLGPTTTLFNALRIAVVPEIIRFGGSGTAAGRRTIRITAVGSVAVAATASVVLLLLPDPAGRALLGKTWPETSVVLLPICVSRLAFAFETRALISLRADRRLRELVIARTLSVLVVDLRQRSPRSPATST